MNVGAPGATDWPIAQYATPRRLQGGLRLAALSAFVAVSYYLGSLLGLVLRVPPETTSVLWPPNAILTAALLLTPSPRRWWIYLAAAFPAHLAVQLGTGWPRAMILALYFTNCSEALIAAGCLRRLDPMRVRFDTLKGMASFLVAAVLVAPLLSSFDDDDLYAPAPGGGFDGGAGGWQLENGASVGGASSGLNVLGMSTGSLSLPAGASAVSPTFCVDERYPHFRFSFVQESLEEDADIRVEVVYPGLAKDNVRKAKDVKAHRNRGWELSDRIDLDPLHGLKKGAGWRLVAVRVSVPSGKPGAKVHVDDVLIDPRARA